MSYVVITSIIPTNTSIGVLARLRDQIPVWWEPVIASFIKVVGGGRNIQWLKCNILASAGAFRKTQTLYITCCVECFNERMELQFVRWSAALRCYDLTCLSGTVCDCAPMTRNPFNVDAITSAVGTCNGLLIGILVKQAKQQAEWWCVQCKCQLHLWSN